MLQEALKIKQDGVIGQQTIKAAVAASDAVCADFLSIRAVRYANTANFWRSGFNVSQFCRNIYTSN